MGDAAANAGNAANTTVETAADVKKGGFFQRAKEWGKNTVAKGKEFYEENKSDFTELAQNGKAAMSSFNAAKTSFNAATGRTGNTQTAANTTNTTTTQQNVTRPNIKTNTSRLSSGFNMMNKTGNHQINTSRLNDLQKKRF